MEVRRHQDADPRGRDDLKRRAVPAGYKATLTGRPRLVANRSWTGVASARHGRPGEWTCDDVEGARREANETAKLWGIHGPTPEEVWKNRVPITAGERAAFTRTVERLRWEVRARREATGIVESGLPRGGNCLLKIRERRTDD